MLAHLPVLDRVAMEEVARRRAGLRRPAYRSPNHSFKTGPSFGAGSTRVSPRRTTSTSKNSQPEATGPPVCITSSAGSRKPASKQIAFISTATAQSSSPANPAKDQRLVRSARRRARLPRAASRASHGPLTGSNRRPLHTEPKCVRAVFGPCSVSLPIKKSEYTTIQGNQRADARIRTADPFITRVDRGWHPVPSSPSRPCRQAKTADSEGLRGAQGT